MSPTKEGLFHLGLEPRAIWPTHAHLTTSSSHTHKYSLVPQLKTTAEAG